MSESTQYENAEEIIDVDPADEAEESAGVAEVEAAEPAVAQDAEPKLTAEEHALLVAHAQAEVADAERVVGEAKRKLAEKQRIADEAWLRAEKAGRTPTTVHIKAYLDRQNAERARKGEARLALTQAGITPELLRSIAGSPLDQAMARRRGRGASRPVVGQPGVPRG